MPDSGSANPVMLLKVHQQLRGDVYRDVVRIPEKHRRDVKGRRVPEGTIVRLTVSDGGASKVVWLRGIEGEAKPWIRMDDKARNELGVVTNQEYYFTIERVRTCGKLCWALDSSDPAVCLAAWLAVISVALGVLSVALALLA